MDAPIINMIVTFFIIIFVLRRMQEVAKKGRDITAPPIPRTTFGERKTDDEREDEEYSFPEPRKIDREASFEGEEPSDGSWRGNVQGELRPETVRRRFEVPGEPPRPRMRQAPAIPMPSARRHRPVDEDTNEVWPETVLAARGDGEGSRGFDRTAAPRVVQEAGRHERPSKHPRGLVPHFGRRELIRGIIMREVLGPPVGMRSE